MQPGLAVRIEPLLPPEQGMTGRPQAPHRRVVEGIVFRYRAGVPWRDLPDEFGPWQTVWKRHHKWSADGTWDRVLGELPADADTTASSSTCRTSMGSQRKKALPPGETDRALAKRSTSPASRMITPIQPGA